MLGRRLSPTTKDAHPVGAPPSFVSADIVAVGGKSNTETTWSCGHNHVTFQAIRLTLAQRAWSDIVRSRPASLSACEQFAATVHASREYTRPLSQRLTS